MVDCFRSLYVLPVPLGLFSRYPVFNLQACSLGNWLLGTAWRANLSRLCLTSCPFSTVVGTSPTWYNKQLGKWVGFLPVNNAQIRIFLNLIKWSYQYYSFFHQFTIFKVPYIGKLSLTELLSNRQPVLGSSRIAVQIHVNIIRSAILRE